MLKELEMERIEDFYYELSDRDLLLAARQGDAAAIAAWVERCREQGTFKALSEAERVTRVLEILANGSKEE